MSLAFFLVRQLRDVVALLICGALGALSAAHVDAQDASGAPSPSITPAPVPTAAEASPEPAPSTSAEPATAATTDAAAPNAEASVEAPAPITASAGSRAELERRLHELEAERAHWTNFLPWLTVGTGASAVLLGTVVGVAAAFDCKPDTTCAAPPWATLIVVVGAAIGTAGAFWLVRTDVGIRELELQAARVRFDLDQFDHARLHRERGVATLDSPPLTLRASF